VTQPPPVAFAFANEQSNTGAVPPDAAGPDTAAPDTAAPSATERARDNDPLRLDSSTVRVAAALQRELVARLDESGPVHIDGGAVERVDTASLQLLAAFVRDLRAASRPVEWLARSDALERAAQSLGLGRALGFPASEL
jgi:ABC-type transporter Mla MlaB component